MSTAVIIMILLGVCMIGVSFLIKDDNREINSQISQVNTSNQNIELTDKQKEDIKSQINNLIEEQLNSIDDRTEASLDRISNTKILEMNEYADTIMNEISRNHNETVFLYDMLNEKAKEVKGTVKDVNIATEQAKKIQSASLGLEKNDSDVAAQKDKAKSRLKELSKQSDTAEKSPDMRTKAGNQAENLSSMMEKERMTEHTEDTVFTGSVLAVNNVLDTVQKAFLLRSCRDNVFKNRERPCLMYQIKRCSAPCVGRISKEDYHKLVREAVDFLDGKNTKIQAELSEKMQEASDRQDYEQALVFRDRIRALTNVQTGTMVEYATISSCDIVAIARKNDVVCIQVFFIRSGQNCGNVPYFPKQTQGAEDGEILEAFLGSFYSEHIPPKEVIVSQPLENGEFLEEALGTHINTYQKGAKAKLLSNVLDNAYASIDRKMAMEASVKSNLEEMQRVFNLPRLPQRIEIYDNSHIQGSYAIGAMVVATPEGFDKKSYRTFNIKNSEITNDDFAMMKEVLTRRFNRMAPENRPDVILLDGGLGQLHAVHEALKDFDLTGISIIAISKGPERNAGKEFYHQLGKESFALPFQSPIAFYLQNLRDESHRFAIGTHRKKRAKSITKSRLDEVEGIGAKRKRDLLNYFGSVEEISQAGIKDIEKVGGISKKTAEKIYNYFHK